MAGAEILPRYAVIVCYNVTKGAPWMLDTATASGQSETEKPEQLRNHNRVIASLNIQFCRLPSPLWFGS